MADEPTGALDTTTESAAADDAASQNGVADNTDAGDGADETKQELERLKKTVADQQGLLESWKPRIEEANRIRQQAAASPATADPVTADIAELDSYLTQLDAAMTAPELTPQQKQWINSERIAKKATRNLLAGQREFEQGNRRLAEAEPTFSGDKEFGDKARQIFVQGRAASAQDAILLARGEAAKGMNISAETRQREADDEARRKAASKPATGGASSNGSAARTKMPFSTYLQRVNAGDSKLAKQNDLGLLDLDYNR